MTTNRNICYLAFLIWFAFAASILGFLCQFVWIKILIPGPQWGQINFGIIAVIMLASSWFLSTFVPVFMVKRLSLELHLTSNWSKVVAIAGGILAFVCYMYGGIFLYSYYAPFDAWLLRHDPTFFGDQFYGVFFVVGLFFPVVVGYVLWKNFNVKYVW